MASTLVYDIFSAIPTFVRVSLYTSIAALVALLVIYARPPLPPNAPKQLRESYPILGSLRFFTARWDFFRDAVKSSPTGNFSFFIGKHSVVGLSGPESRKVFFENSGLGFAEGYAVLFNGVPATKAESKDLTSDPDFSAYFSRRLTVLLKRERLAKSLSHFANDVQTRLDQLENSGSDLTDPYISIYEIVFCLTMRMVGCHEIVQDPALLKKTLHLFETVEKSSNAATIIFPWFPSLGVIRRTVAGGRLYMIFKKIIDDRAATGRREDDPLQFLLDQGDSVTEIITFVIGALFAGQLNSGINAAAVLMYLGVNPLWMKKIRKEADQALASHGADPTASFEQKLHSIPLEAWESEFPLTESCLRESIRLNMLGTAFRQNITDHAIPVGSESIPSRAYVVYHVNDIHKDPSIYVKPEEWDPARYLPDREEDKKLPHAYMGWGTGKHPCLGMRFAKLEQNVIVAAFLGRFDYEVVDKHGVKLDQLEPVDDNKATAHKPKIRAFIKFKPKTSTT